MPEGSAAAAAGLKGLTRTRRGLALADVIVGVDAVRVKHFDDLYTALDAHHPEDAVKLVVCGGRPRSPSPSSSQRSPHRG